MSALQKLSKIAFRWDSVGSFFAYASLTSLENKKQKNCQSEQDVDQVLHSAMDGASLYTELRKIRRIFVEPGTKEMTLSRRRNEEQLCKAMKQR